MADQELPSSSRPSRAPPPSSNTDLLHTIAQLREQRASSSLQNKAVAAADYRQGQGSLSSQASSSGRRRLCKVRSNEVHRDSPVGNLYDDLEDWHEEEVLENPGSADLANSLDKLSITTDHSREASDDAKSSEQKPRPKIMDSLAFLNEVRKLSASEKANRRVTVVGDDAESLHVKKGSDISNLHDTKRDDRTDMLLLNKPSLVPKLHGGFASKSIKAEVCWDLEDEKENSGGEAVTFVHNKLVFKLPKKIANILYPHQHEGIKWLWGLHVKGMGGILGDDMGLGKTMQIASFFVGLFASDLIKHALIVAPKTLIAHWSKELSFVGLARKTKDYSGTSASQRQHALQHVLQLGGILLTTYDVVRNNWQALRGDFHGRDGFGDTSEDIITWDYMVLDEGHLIKNPSTQRAKSLKEIPCAHRIVLSGTPIQNNLREMWALFDFCCPELLGDRKEFKARYEDFILSANSKDSTDRQKRAGSAVAQELRKRIAPFFLRRLKSEVFPSSDDTASCKLPRKTDLIVWLRLTERQRELYTAFLESKTAHQSLEGSALAALTVLKKICDHPSLLTQRAADDIAEGMESMLNAQDAAEIESMSASVAKILDEDEGLTESHEALSCKIAFIMILLERLIDEGHRTLVFAQTRKMLDIIQREATKKQYRFVRIDGTMKASDRERFVQEYQKNDSIPIFLLTSKVGGLGLTLTAANRVIIVDPAWNPSTDNQSVDRAYRIGQKRDVIIYRLMTSGTIEEKIYRKQVFKGGLFKVATEHKEQFRYFSHQELHELLTLPKTGFDISVTQQQLHEEHSMQYQRDEQLEEHITFLESQNIAGVSHHDLLFSKQAPELPAAENESWDLQHWRHGASGPRPDILSLPPQEWHTKVEPKIESEEVLLERQKVEVSAHISRLSSTLSDKALISRLPDKGSNLRKKLEDLNRQMKNLEYIGGLKKENVPVPSSTVSVKTEACELEEVATILAGLKM
ncbi:hypothetical protein GOP47_0029756 [Adiantum capillus-veneris]|nr:hypothetical protein GOP47_0029756 [Adiantum capillus-veneris]